MRADVEPAARPAVVEADEPHAPVAAHERRERPHETRIVERDAPLRDHERLRRVRLVEAVRPHERVRPEVVVVVSIRVEEARAREVVPEAVASDRRLADRERVPDITVSFGYGFTGTSPA